MQISIHDSQALDSFRKEHRLDPEMIRLVRKAFYKNLNTPEDAVEALAEPARSHFLEQIRFHSLNLAERRDSAEDGATKLLFRTDAGHLLESVLLRIQSGRTSLCVSSQVGCAARCGFCATGQLEVVVQLSAAEILDQLAQAQRFVQGEGRSIRNVVFMGMGEPFHNEDAVCEAVEVMLSPRCFGLSPAHLLISTVGIPDAMIRFARRFPKVGLALSLHAARPEVRARLMPIAKKYSLKQLRETIHEVNRLQERAVMVEYLMLAGVNDSDLDREALDQFLTGLRVHVNLIPFNPFAGNGFAGSSPDRCRAFAEALSVEGRPVTIRRSLGRDIAAACGQLALQGR